MLKDVDVASLQTQLQEQLQTLGAHQAAADAYELIGRLHTQLKFKQTKIDALTFELARLKRWRFGKSSESLDAQGANPQAQLFDAKTETLLVEESKAEDRAENEARTPSPRQTKRQAKRQALPSQLERIDHHYEIEPGVCSAGHALKRIGQEISEQLDCVPAQFFANPQARATFAASTPVFVATPCWLHQCLRRSSTKASRPQDCWPKSSLQSMMTTCPCTAKKRSTAEAGRSSPEAAWPAGSEVAVCNSRQGQHAATLLEGFEGSLLCDDYAGYKALFKHQKISEAGCWSHARRKFFEAHKLNQSELAKEALHRIQALYELERQGALLDQQERHQLRQTKSVPLLKEFKAWLLSQRQQLMNADVTAKAMDYTLKRWAALTIHLSEARIPIDNNAVENAIRPLALGRKNWLFVGSQQAGERAAVLMTLIESAKLNGHDAWAYLKDVLTKLPTWPNSRLHELLPHKWVPPETATATAPSTPDH